MPSVVVLGTQVQNMKMRSPKFINKNIAQKVMAKSSFEYRFMTLNI